MAAAGDAAFVRLDDFTAQLSRIVVPTLVIMGEEDPEVALAATMAANIAGARYLTLPGAGHLSSVESPQAFETAVLDFLHGLEPLSGEGRNEPGPALAAV